MHNRKILWIPSLICFFFFLPTLISGDFFHSNDIAYLHYATRRWFFSQILEGQFPIWNEQVFLGLYQIANPTLGLFHPFNVLYFIFDDYLAHQLLIIIHGIWGALGMTLWLSLLTRSDRVGCFGGIAFGLSGFFVGSIKHFNTFLGAAWYPWVLWSYLRFRKQPRASTLVVWIINVVAVALIGDPIGMLLLLGFCGVDFIYRIYRSNFSTIRHSLFLFGLGIGIVFCLTAIVFLPSAEIMQESRRASNWTFLQTAYFSVHPYRLLTLVVPYFWGAFDNNTFWGFNIQNGLASPRFWSDSIYLGIPVLLFAALALFKKPFDKFSYFLFFVALFFLMMCFGSFGFLHQILYEIVPFYARLRFPEKFYMIFTLCVITLAGLGIGHLFDDSEHTITRVKKLFGLNAVFFISASFIALFSFPAANEIAMKQNFTAVKLRLFETTMSKQLCFTLALASLWLIAFVFLKYSKRLQAAQYPYWFPILVVLLCIELVIFAPPLLKLKDTNFNLTSRLDLSTDIKSRTRVLRDLNLDRYSIQQDYPRSTLSPNWGLLEDIAYVFGNGPMVPHRFDKLVGDIIYQHVPQLHRILAFDHILTQRSPRDPNLKIAYENQWLKLEQVDEQKNLVVLKPTTTYQRIEIFYETRLTTNPSDAFNLVLDRASSEKFAIVEPDIVLWKGRFANKNERKLIWQQIINRQRADKFFQTKASWQQISNSSNTQHVEYQIASNSKTSEQIPLNSQTTDTQAIKNDLPNFFQNSLFVRRVRLSSGWRAYFNKKEIPIFMTDYLNQGVFIPESNGLLEFKFEPKSWLWAKWLLIMGIIFLVLLSLNTIFNNDYSK